ncbi:HesA/MoeB/ThiF family protein [Nereida sp. MMG025]|uniref:HesA/MoeB/ThiF family protein n=1 Tax=Nereida sp. MMG025 TaxID=2909981 RepID=UPI001F265BBF|nr:HesA/MoeB/ThiF family protein [Nereida sp. MMG025]MCF6445549.1 HesA/MoeB/ThiF family protein [Nereida sp. MMG025]
MLVVFSMAAFLWGFGMLTKTPHQARWIMIGLLFVGVLAIHIVLPDGHPLREGTGGDERFWLLLAALAGLVLLYRRGLMWIRARTNPVSFDPPPSDKLFADVELERAARQIVLREIGGVGQKTLKEAKVLVIGAGGLGAPALMYLGAAGVGTIGIIDGDVVENSNLQRQIIHDDAAIGTPKVFSAETRLKAQNPFVSVRPYHRELSDEIAHDLFAEYDLILDGTDNYATRALVNRTCVALGKPLIAAALTQWEGQISTYHPPDAPCYACVFPKPADPSLVPSCAEAGVVGPLPGVLGAMMAVEAIKELTQAGVGLRGQMLIYDGLYGESRKIALKRDPDCPVCKEA